MENFKQNSGHCYWVKNQNAFNQAIYHYFGEDTDYSKKEIRSMVQTYPTKYPCTIVIVDLTFESNRIYIESF